MRPPRLLFDVTLALAIVTIVHLLYSRQSGDLSIQSQLNARFAERTSLGVALERYPKLRPPLYPMLLWSAARLALPLAAVNETLLLASLGLLALCATRIALLRDWRLLVVAYALARFNYTNLYQLTAEALFVPLLLGLLLALGREQRGGSRATLAAVALLTSALCLSRYFALYFALPLVLVNLLFLAARPWRARITRAFTVFLASAVPIGLWTFVTYRETGEWTGADRSGPRRLPEAVHHWNELTGFLAHVRLGAKTLLVDFFSPTHDASHSIVTEPYALSGFEWLSLGVLAAVIALTAWSLWRRRSTLGSPRSFLFIATEMAVGYLGATLVVWTFGNNDPLYTRFLYPIYALVLLLGFAAYGLVRATGSFWTRFPFAVLFVLFVVAQLLRDHYAQPLPVRYLW